MELETKLIQDVVYQAIDKVNELLLDVNLLSKEDNTILIGEGSSLDSMGFVNFVVALEEELARELNCNLDIVGELKAAGVQARQCFTVVEFIGFLRGLADSKGLQHD